MKKEQLTCKTRVTKPVCDNAAAVRLWAEATSLGKVSTRGGCGGGCGGCGSGGCGGCCGGSGGGADVVLRTSVCPFARTHSRAN